jgi:2-polyprenyl-3-methyl-5-hydroxy-6-metoxy-1,4-benzoquinol methylase
MQWLQLLQAKLLAHKYAIDARLLGDNAILPWSNLGDWSRQTLNSKKSYPQACENLAVGLADHLNLNSNDQLLDLGCGQGASLLLWQQKYAVKHIEGIELQPLHVAKICQHLPNLTAIHCMDFLNSKQFEFKKFDVVLCIDAAYHANLNSFLSAITPLLNSKGRLGFHTLIWSNEYLNSNFLVQHKYQMLLKAADIRAQDLMTEENLKSCLNTYDFEKIEVIDLSEAVLSGFSDYVNQLVKPVNAERIDWLKIQMTAKLCRTLYKDGYVRYVQITANKKGESN